MESLINKNTNEQIVRFIDRAYSFWDRVKGLLGKGSLPDSYALWILPCPVIHTFFMKFPIDVIFVDKNLKVVSVFHSIPSRRIIYGGWKSHSVFELQANKLQHFNIKKGDQLYVGH
ncbi:MAG: DUF192 domain-containing protein [Bdellovibrionales bacterium]|nr:DUF192 domain-containing protein [Bdellovibrionales bacterium]